MSDNATQPQQDDTKPAPVDPNTAFPPSKGPPEQLPQEEAE